MNRLQHWITAKTAYNIQSPFLYSLYTDVLSTRIDSSTAERLGINAGSKYDMLVFKLADYYNATSSDINNGPLPFADSLLTMPDGSLIGIVESPHKDQLREKKWDQLCIDPIVTLSVDLFYAGVVFTSSKLSKQHYLLR